MSIEHFWWVQLSTFPLLGGVAEGRSLLAFGFRKPWESPGGVGAASADPEKVSVLLSQLLCKPLLPLVLREPRAKDELYKAKTSKGGYCFSDIFWKYCIFVD